MRTSAPFSFFVASRSELFAVNETSNQMRELGTPLSRDLAEMLLTQIDIQNSSASLMLWSQSYISEEQHPNKQVIEDSLFRDGITQFVGCFDSQNAVPLVVETVYPDAEGIDVYFRWLRGLRNSYTAHRHGAARQCVVGIFIDANGNHLGSGQLFAAYRGPSKDGHADLLKVVSQALRFTENKIAILRSELEVEAKALTAEQRLKLPTAKVQPPGPEDMRKSRGDVRNGLSRLDDESTE
jgi:hypothetical protein